MVLIGNPSKNTKNYVLEFHKEINEGGKPIFKEAELTLKMDEKIFSAWKRGGKQTQLLKPAIQQQTRSFSRSGTMKKDESKQLITGNNATLGRLVLKPKESG